MIISAPLMDLPASGWRAFSWAFICLSLLDCAGNDAADLLAAFAFRHLGRRSCLSRLAGLGQERHHPAQALPDRLDRAVGVLGAHLVEPRPAGLVLGDPLACEGSALDVG